MNFNKLIWFVWKSINRVFMLVIDSKYKMYFWINNGQKNINKLPINYYSEIRLMSWNFIQKYLAETLGLNKYQVQFSSPEKIGC